jgi:L-alanine-DL-glutamate epimerase-like enolase superfamily enzyme
MLRRLKLPLRVPYKLAFGLVRHFDTLLVELTDVDGRVGYGEATILNGYTDETVEGSWTRLQQLTSVIAGSDSLDIEALTAPDLKDYPFVVSALVTACEMLHAPELFRTSSTLRVPILGVVNGVTDQAVGQEIDTLIMRGYTTLKVKVGFDVADDLAQVARVQRAAAGRARIRIDGNQGYDRDQAREFLAGLSPEAIELFEQPCPAEDWASARELARLSHVPMMLDESIYGLDDIERAAEFGCAHFIKLKLMKMGGFRRLCSGLDLIRNLGMTAVLGNGVASDIGCWMEAVAASSHVVTAGEMNGFLKPVASVLEGGLAADGGDIVITADFWPRLDTSGFEHCVVDRCSVT